LERTAFTSENEEKGEMKMISSGKRASFPKVLAHVIHRKLKLALILSIYFDRFESLEHSKDSRSSMDIDLALESCHSTIEKDGWVHIPKFIPSHQVESMLSEVESLQLSGKTGFNSFDSHTVYQEEIDDLLPPDHPRNQLQQSSKTIIDLMELSENSTLRSTYMRSDILELVKRCTGLTEVFLSACPYNAAYYNIYNVGDGLGWHFDRSAFGVNLVLQLPGGGGNFDYHHQTRYISSPSSLHSLEYDTIRNILQGNLSGVVTVDGIQPGSLIIFAGLQSLHRVTTITETPPRINAILTYETMPGQKLNDYSLQKFFGRHIPGE
jgi:hypothetical protein